MKTVGNLNWDKIRDWLAEAGSISSGFYVDHQEPRVSGPKLLPRRRFDQPRNAAKADSTTSWVASDREF